MGMSYGGFIYVEHSFLSHIELNGMNATINGSKIESLASNVFFFPIIVQIPITSFAKIIQSNISALYYGILVLNGSLTLENGTYYSGSGIFSSVEIDDTSNIANSSISLLVIGNSTAVIKNITMGVSPYSYMSPFVFVCDSQVTINDSYLGYIFIRNNTVLKVYRSVSLGILRTMLQHYYWIILL